MNPTQLRSETLRRFDQWRLKPNLHLPLLESESELRPKSAAAVAARAVAASSVAAVCFGAPASRVRSDLQRFELWEHLSTEEQEFMTEVDASDQSAGVHSWLVESIQVMAWALNLVNLEHLAPCTDALASHFPRGGAEPRRFIAAARLRPLHELLQEADTLYMLHWSAVEGNLTRTPDPRVVLPRVSYRRHAADWLIGTADAWEDVPLDT